MTDLGDLVHALRNTAAREIIRALERDGFSLKRETASAPASMLIQTVESPSFTITTAVIRSLEKRCGVFSKQ
jgi:hypothetical protein